VRTKRGAASRAAMTGYFHLEVENDFAEILDLIAQDGHAAAEG
jgi:hypothetical protein